MFVCLFVCLFVYLKSRKKRTEGNFGFYVICCCFVLFCFLIDLECSLFNAHTWDLHKHGPGRCHFASGSAVFVTSWARSACVTGDVMRRHRSNRGDTVPVTSYNVLRARTEFTTWRGDGYREHRNIDALLPRTPPPPHTHTHIHTFIFIFILVYLQDYEQSI